MNGQGRRIIPDDICDALAEPKDDLIFILEGKKFLLRPRESVESDLWGMFSSVEGSLTGELIRERRAEADREG